ncbi:lipopolysaccharide heptosyltransferase II [bacterium]
MNKDFNISDVKNILVIQTAFLGDIVLTIPLLNNIKKLGHNRKLTVLTIPVGKEILKGQNSIDDIIVYDKKRSDKGIKKLFELINTIKQKKFDWAVIPHRSFRSAFLTWRAKIPNRWGFDISEGKYFLTKKIKYNFNMHDIDRNLEFLKSFTSEFDKRIDFESIAQVNEKVTNILDERSFQKGKIIGINPGSVWATKRWPIDKYIELIRILITKGYKIVVFGDKFDQMIKEQIDSEFSNHNNFLNIIGKTTIQELTAFFRCLALYITNDSGPMHIAAALGIPIIAIFGPTTKELGFFPYTDKAVIIEKNLPCRPCGRHGSKKCPKKHFKCMKEISVEEIINVIEKNRLQQRSKGSNLKL